jgi:hypothetical protein
MRIPFSKKVKLNTEEAQPFAAHEFNNGTPDDVPNFQNLLQRFQP